MSESKEPNLGMIFLLAAGLLLLVSLACNTVTGVREDVQNLQGTAQAAATTVQQGKDLLATGQAMATRVLGNEVMQTARAVATEGGSRLLATVQAVATEGARRNATQAALDATSQGMSTRRSPALEETAQALVTQQFSHLAATAWAIATQGAFEAQVPDDVPVVPQHKENMFASPDLISYTVRQPFREVVDYYEGQMPVYGWRRRDDASAVMESSAILSFEKDGKAAFINLSVDPTHGILVVISIQAR